MTNGETINSENGKRMAVCCGSNWVLFERTSVTPDGHALYDAMAATKDKAQAEKWVREG